MKLVEQSEPSLCRKETFEAEAEQMQRIAKVFEQQYEELAREILDGRNRVLTNKKRLLPLKKVK